MRWASPSTPTSFRRPGLQALLRAVRQRPLPFQALVIAEPSRLGREQVETAYVLKQITDAGVEVWGYQDGRPLTMATSTDKIMFSIQAMAAESERERGRQRTRDALTRKARLGHATGAAAYGYRLVRVGDHSKRAVDPAEAAVVVRAFALAASGLGDDRVAHQLTADAPGARRWARDRVRRMLRNPLYVGRAVYGRTRAVDRDGSVNRRARVPAEDQVAANVPALRIVPDALWDAVQARKRGTRQHYAGASTTTTSGITSSYLLAGIARCGSGMVVTGRAPRYFCSARIRYGPAGCANKRGVPVEDLDDAVRERLHALLSGDAEAVRKLSSEMRQSASDICESPS